MVSCTGFEDWVLLFSRALQVFMAGNRIMGVVDLSETKRAVYCRQVATGFALFNVLTLLHLAMLGVV